MSRLILSNVDELLDLVATERVNDKRFNLNSRNEQVWIDETAGNAWNAARMDLSFPSRKDFIVNNEVDEDAYRKAEANYYTQADELQKVRPASKNVTIYTLNETYKMGYYRHSTIIDLSEELGEMLNEVWTKKEPYKNSSYKVNYGALSLMGMLKRLGANLKEVDAKIKARKEAETHRSLVNKTNYARETVRKSAQTIIANLQDAGISNPAIVDMLNTLTKIENMEA